MIDNNPELTTSATFAIDWQTVRYALDLVNGFLHAFDFSADVRARLAIVVEELVANVVEHGACPPDQPMTLTLGVQGETITVGVTDYGTYFDLSTAEISGTVPPEQGGGAGIALVRHWAHDISYSRVDGRNVLNLIIPTNG
jgi:serine/threonine-protein kinase RsbW